MITAATILLLTGIGFVGLGIGSQYYVDAKYKKDYQKYLKQLANNAGIRLDNGKRSEQEFEAYLNDAVLLGYLPKDKKTYQEGIQAFNKLRYNNWDLEELSNEEIHNLNTLYSDLYNNYPEFKSQWDNVYSKLPMEEKLKYLDGARTTDFPIPAPAYLDTSFDRYQKEVEPLKFYTNKELADIYNIDYDYDSIKKDLDNAAQAEVDYRMWQSDLLKNNAERNNTQSITDYLDAIRKTKSDAVINGVSTGARAAAEVLATNDAQRNKAATNLETATKRMETTDAALLERASTALKAQQLYDQLAQTLSSGGVSLYANDVNRLGQDLLSNANFLSADENLRSNRAAQNALMASIYNNVAAQNQANINAANERDNYFRTVSLPAYQNDFSAALQDYLDLAYQQNTGYRNIISKWNQVNNPND